jgi:hypothetical protein
VDTVFAILREAERAGELVIDQQRLRRSPWHTQLWVTKGHRESIVDLKIDLVNDTAPRVGDVGIDPVALHGILRTVPPEELARVAWASPVDLAGILADLRVIADDILYRRENSLFMR